MDMVRVLHWQKEVGPCIPDGDSLRQLSSAAWIKQRSVMIIELKPDEMNLDKPKVNG